MDHCASPFPIEKTTIYSAAAVARAERKEGQMLSDRRREELDTRHVGKRRTVNELSVVVDDPLDEALRLEESDGGAGKGTVDLEEERPN